MSKNDELIGQQLDEYRLEDLLGRGGMARVYRAIDVRLKRWVAIKVIDTPFRRDESYLMRFEREAQAIAQLQHPNIVSIYRYGEVNEVLYMAMQFVQGSALDAVLQSYHHEGELMPVEEARRIIREVCMALDYAHDRGVIHRDIKPANIMLDKQGTAILADFGLALLEDVGTQGEIFGTPHYIAPEQAISSAGAVPQSDLYAVGVIVYEMFTGVVPFDGPDPLEVAMKHMTDEVPSPLEANPDLTPELSEVILKALAKEPADRYQNGAELFAAIDKALKAKRKATSHILDSRMTVSHRVSLDLADNPLPPVPPSVATPVVPPAKPAPEETTAPPLPPMPEPAPKPQPEPVPVTPTPTAAAQPSPTKVDSPSTTASTPPPPNGSASAASPAASSNPLASVPPDKLPFVYAGIGAAVIFILGLCFMLLSGGGADEPTVAQEATTDTAAIALETPQPGQEIIPEDSNQPAGDSGEPVGDSGEPVAEAEPTEEPEPQLIADSQADFSSSPDGTWFYMWSDRGENDWQQMDEYSNNHYGDSCWYIGRKKHIRVCDNSGHPGKEEDVAWVWRSEVSGTLEVQLAMNLKERSKDGVLIKAYHIAEQEGNQIFEFLLDHNDTDPEAESFQVENIAPDDALFFVLDSQGNSDRDHTIFQAIICHPTCPEDGAEDEDNGGFQFNVN